MHLVQKVDTNCFSAGHQSPNTTANLVWAKTYISGNVMHNAVGIVTRKRNT